MKKIFFLLIVLAILVGFTLPAGAVDLGVRGYWWFTSIDGDLRADAGGLTGTKVDLDNDLGMGDESYPIVEAFVGLGNHHFSFAYYRAEYDGTNDLTKNIVFNGEVFTVGDRISSKLNYDAFDLKYQYDFLNLENVLAGFSLGAVVRVEVFDGEAEVKSQTLGTTTRETFMEPIPLVGLNCHVGLLADILEARVLATGFTYGDESAIDAQADVSWTPFPFLDLHGGYRILHIDVDRSDVEANFSTSGPYLALTLSI
jgi:hypothetical protein